MDITFFVGNGFDISQGLKTTYTNFLEWYLSFDSVDSDINSFKRNTIEKDLETWADAEMAFGMVTDRFSDETIPILQKCIDDFSTELSKYLRNQTSTREIDSNTTAKAVTRGLTQIVKLLRPESEKQVSGVLLSYSSQNWKYNFVNYNYTNLLDRVIGTIGIENQEFTTHRDGRNNVFKDVVGEMIHIHGTTDNEMIFGVDSELQISNEQLRNSSTIKNYLIKPETIRRLKTGVAQNVRTLVDKSSIVVIYGMSLGATDASWWAYIAKWLKTNPQGQLIIFTHNNAYNPLLPRSFMDTEDSVEGKFFSYSSFDEKTMEDLKKRIHIVINEDLFEVSYQTEENKLRQAYMDSIEQERS